MQNVFRNPDQVGLVGQLGTQESKFREYILMIDSRDRRYTEAGTLEGSPSDYIVDLDSSFENVVSVELLEAMIPRTQLTVNSNNRIFPANFNGNPITAVMEIGNYTANQLASELQDKLNAAVSATAAFTVSPDTNAQKFYIYLSNTASLSADYTGTFTVNSTYPNNTNERFTTSYELLGFDRAERYPAAGTTIYSQTYTATNGNFRIGDVINTNYTIVGIEAGNRVYYSTTAAAIGNSTGISAPQSTANPLNSNATGTTSSTAVTALVSENIYNLGDSGYVIMHINSMPRVRSIGTSGLDQYATISFSVPQSGIENWQKNSKHPVVYTCNPMISRLKRLHISFYNYNGSPYDFNDAEHMLLFKITCVQVADNRLGHRVRV